jgi:hypothetical protein
VSGERLPHRKWFADYFRTSGIINKSSQKFGRADNQAGAATMTNTIQPAAVASRLVHSCGQLAISNFHTQMAGKRR